MRDPKAMTAASQALRRVALRGCTGLMGVAVLATTHAMPTEGEPVRPCRLAVFVNDPDPSGLNLRSAAATESRIVTTIVDGDAMVDVTGSSGKWLRVERVRGADGTVQFEGKAWIFGPLTGVRATRALDLHAAAQQTSAVVATMPADQIGAVQECDGAWVRVRNGKGSGWMAPGSHCGNSVTGCV